jgi:phosphonate degradation associated HDIG domain protein
VSNPTVDDVLDLYRRHGRERYDEDLSQLAHAEQTAALAGVAGASDALVVAALLHDVGHLLEVAETSGRDRRRDGRHEARGAAWLAAVFPTAVTAPIALHVRAKRYLCTVEPEYADALSAGSVASLERQGGTLSPEEVAAFEERRGWADAIELRRWDDRAKVLDLEVAPIDEHRALLLRVAALRGGARADG